MLNKVLAIIFIVLFSVALAWAAMFCIDAIEGEKWAVALMSAAIAGISIFRIAYYAKALSHRDEDR